MLVATAFLNTQRNAKSETGNVISCVNMSIACCEFLHVVCKNTDLPWRTSVGVLFVWFFRLL